MRENVTTYMYGLAKYVIRVKRTESEVTEVKQRYFIGIKYWEKSSTRPRSFMDTVKQAYGL